jgi:hypothetical protein
MELLNLFKSPVTYALSHLKDIGSFYLLKLQLCLNLYLDGYTASVITFQWAEHSMTFKDGIKHSQFEIGEPMSFKCDRAYVTGDLKRFNNSLFCIIYLSNIFIIILVKKKYAKEMSKYENHPHIYLYYNKYIL